MFQHWNNWIPPSTTFSKGILNKSKDFVERNNQKFFLDDIKQCRLPSGLQNRLYKCTKHTKNSRNWISPRHFDLLLRTDHFNNHVQNESIHLGGSYICESKYCTTNVRTRKYRSMQDGSERIRVQNLLSLNKTELHDVSQVQEGDILTGIVERNFLETAKIWKDAYGNVSCFAEGEIAKFGSQHKTRFHIINPDLLRKFLNITVSQWTALTECVTNKKLNLKYNVQEKCDMTKLTTLERLWYLLCKRRHVLPAVCVKVQLTGAVKLKTVWKILPKLVVLEVYEIEQSETHL